MSRDLTLSYSSRCIAGIKNDNEDAIAELIPENAHLLAFKGAAFALADGVSSAEAGKLASHIAVNDFISDYFKTPDTWALDYSAEQTLARINLDLYHRSHAFTNEEKGFLCTFSALIIKSRHAYAVHIGDSRIYHFSQGQLTQLTCDHKIQINAQQSYLARALGMDNRLAVDINSCEIREGDIFLLSSDGIHDFVSTAELMQQLSRTESPDTIGQALVDLALANGSDDNISVILCVVQTLPDENIDDYTQRLTQQPFPPHLNPGDKLDHYLIERELFSSQRSHLYEVKDTLNGKHYALKAPSPNYSEDPQYIERFIREEWIGSRIKHPFVVEVVHTNETKSGLYYVMELVEGMSLDLWMKTQCPVRPSRAIKLIDNIAAGLEAFHRSGATHQDLKPQNIMVLANEDIKIVDFGSTFVAGLDEIFIPLERETILGTATYADPQYLQGKNSGIQGDIYSLGSICYELFTGGSLAYGEAITHCVDARDYDQLRYQSASKAAPYIPQWFDRTLEKSVSFNLEERYFTLKEFLRDLHQPNPNFLREEVKKSTNTNSLVFWKMLSGFWFVTLLLVIYLFLK